MPNGVCSRRIEMDYICLVYVDENRLASLPLTIHFLQPRFGRHRNSMCWKISQ